VSTDSEGPLKPKVNDRRLAAKPTPLVTEYGLVPFVG